MPLGSCAARVINYASWNDGAENTRILHAQTHTHRHTRKHTQTGPGELSKNVVGLTGWRKRKKVQTVGATAAKLAAAVRQTKVTWNLPK